MLHATIPVRRATNYSITITNVVFRPLLFLRSSSKSLLRSRAPKHRSLLTLAIETSCDDTCVAVLEKRSRLDGVRSASASTAAPPPLPVEGDVVQSSSNGIHEDAGTLAKLHFNEKITATNTQWGGIHPIESLNSHNANLSSLISRALASLPGATQNEVHDVRKVIVANDGTIKRKPDFISVTRGPGMRSNLSCGLNTAKGLSVAWQIPLLGVHHMQAHTLTPRLTYALGNPSSAAVGGKDQEGLAPNFPFVTLLVSGGHTMLLLSTGLTAHKIIATTADVAIGDALDKCGRLLLPADVKATANDTAYAKYLSTYAFPTSDDFGSWPVPQSRKDEIDKPLNRFGWQMQTPLANTKDLRFSFTSISSEAERLFHGRGNQKWSSEERLMLARTVLGTAFEHLCSRIVIALQSFQKAGIDIPTLVVSGGVAANDFLRYFLRSMLDARGFGNIDLIFPPVALCTDNAAMIAWTGLEMFEAGFRNEHKIDAIRKWSMDAQSADGGILGADGWTQVAV